MDDGGRIAVVFSGRLDLYPLMPEQKITTQTMGVVAGEVPCVGSSQ
ncbi:hypothetical protein [Bradyrhizobium sp. LCT2]|nr:hypothetical protein [Bradyrhizobium sp. LCT2]